MPGTDVRKIIADLENLSIQDKEKLAETATKVTLDELRTTSLNDAVVTLLDSALEVDGLFYELEHRLESIKASDTLSNKFRRDAGTLLTTWKTHRGEYVKLLWRSKEVAGVAKSATNDYAKNILEFLKMPEDEAAVSVKRDFLDKYLIKLANQEAEVQDVAQGILDLQRKVKYFQSDWDSVVKRNAVKVNTEAHDRIEALMRKGGPLKLDLDKKCINIAELNEIINRMKQAPGEDAAAHKGVSRFLAFSVPEFFSKLTGDIFTKTQSSKIPDVRPIIEEQRGILKDLDKINQDIRKPNADSDAVTTFGAGLTSLTSDFGDFYNVTETIRALAAVSATIIYDTRIIKQSLTSSDNEDPDQPIALWGSRMNKYTADYTVLHQYLELWSTTVVKLPPLA